MSPLSLTWKLIGNKKVREQCAPLLTIILASSAVNIQLPFPPSDQEWSKLVPCIGHPTDDPRARAVSDGGVSTLAINLTPEVVVAVAAQAEARADAALLLMQPQGSSQVLQTKAMRAMLMNSLARLLLQVEAEAEAMVAASRTSRLLLPSTTTTTTSLVLARALGRARTLSPHSPRPARATSPMHAATPELIASRRLLDLPRFPQGKELKQKIKRVS